MNRVSVEKLLEIGIALSSEKDTDKLLDFLLTSALDITNCDGGTLYQKTENSLQFQQILTRSLGIRQGPHYEPISLPPVPLSRENVCGCAVINRSLINIPDVYDSGAYDFSGPKQYDAITGYHTVSMLVVPMEDETGTVIGVPQLINAMDENGRVIPFEKSCEPVIRSFASQAAICITSRNHADEIQNLLNSFVHVMSAAIDARTPYNANHTCRMANYAEKFIDWLTKENECLQFTPEQKRQFLLSVWLHDVGKLTVPLEVMDKESRLGPNLDTVLNRFRIIFLLDRIAALEGRISKEEASQRKETLEAAGRLVLQSNRARFLSEDTVKKIREIAACTYWNENGEEHPWLTGEECEALCVKKGNLTDQERKQIEGHVVMTATLLDKVCFPKSCSHVPTWAADHHELLDGTGYPKGLANGEISREVRLLTILDIFDALTACDRPYKPAMSVEEAFSILEEMAQDGKLDQTILALFLKSRAWEGIS